MDTETQKGIAIAQTKQLRKELDAVLQSIKLSCETRSSGERLIAITKTREAIMWLGMDLKDIGSPNPYPESYNPNSSVIAPTADGLKL